MLQDPRGLMDDGDRRHREHLAKAAAMQAARGEQPGVRHRVAMVLREVAEHIDSVHAEQTSARSRRGRAN